MNPTVSLGRKGAAVLASIALVATVPAPRAAAAPDMGATGIVPAAQDFEPSAGAFTIAKDKLVISISPANSMALADVAAVLSSELKPMTSGVTAGKPQAGGISLVLAEKPLEHGPESHTVEITPTGVVITGNSPAAIFFGTRSLLQMNQAHGGKIPCGVVRDWPDYPGRMMMLDVARKPWPFEVLKDYVRILAWYKMNELHLHLSDESFGEEYWAIRVQSDVFPGLAATDLAYSKAQIRELVAFAKTYGVTITPEFDMPGHAAAFTHYFKDLMLAGHPNYLDVSNPKTLEVMKKFVDEMIPLFDAPDFHIGTDEYRVGSLYPDPKDKTKVNPKVDKIHEDFRKFINAMNAHVRSRGKNCRIWSGFEGMGGKSVKIDPTVIVDMWDPYHDEHNGHSVINSSQFVTYYVPGCHYYGVNPAGLYNGWIPWNAGDNPNKPKKGDPRFLGGKLHVWCDQGPTGYTMNEIATLVRPGIQAISEKLWGTKGSKDYAQFTKRVDSVSAVPGVTVFERIAGPQSSKEADVVLDRPEEVTLADVNSQVPLPLEKAERADLEYPWTLTLEVMKTQDSKGRRVILSSDLVEICADYPWKKKVETKDADGKKRSEDVDFSGIGIVRAAGSLKGSGTPGESRLAHDVSQAFGRKLEKDKWTTLTYVGTRGSTSLYINGEKIDSTKNQAVCPLRRIGSPAGQSFVGKVRKIKVWNRVLTAAEIGRAAGLDIPDNVAFKRPVTASATYQGFDPAAVTDDDAGSRWSSGGGGAQWLTIDLGAEKKIAGAAIVWETAYAKKYGISVSKDGQTWKEVFEGEAKVGDTKATFPTEAARYVRLNFKEAGTGWGYSIFNAEIYSGK